MAVIYMLAVGAVAGVIAHLILRENGYSIAGEMMIGAVGAVSTGLVAGIFTGMRPPLTEAVLISVLVPAAIGAIIVLAVVVYVSTPPGGKKAVD